jgi:hypothetical protein
MSAVQMVRGVGFEPMNIILQSALYLLVLRFDITYVF